MRRLLIATLALALAGFGIAQFTRLPPALPAGSASAAWLAPGPHAVGVLDYALEDRRRPTDANRDAPATPSRKLATRVWYPADGEGALAAGGPFPLLVYSHGFSSYRDEGRYLTEHLASLGYVVVAADFPLTHLRAPGSPRVQDVVNQPGDVSFLIDTALAWSADARHPLHAAVDPARIGTLGVSLGGLTTELVLYHPRWRDARVQAGISIAGPTMMFGPRFFEGAQRPFLMIAGDQDVLVDYGQNALPVLENVPNAALLTLARASHTGFATAARWMRWMENPDALGCAIVKKNLESSGTEAPWYHLFGSPEEGIVQEAENRLCVRDPLPESLNPLQQQRITLLAASSFFQGQFAAQAEVRRQAQDYLEHALPQDFAEVHYQRSHRPGAAAPSPAR